MFLYWSRWKVSIPKWCDYKLWNSLEGILHNLVSIPKWCDYKKIDQIKLIDYCLVSIPKWCDYKCTATSQSIVDVWFQFQNGAIIRQTTTQQM